MTELGMFRNMALGTNCVLPFTLGLRNVTELVTELGLPIGSRAVPCEGRVTELKTCTIGMKYPFLRHDGV